MAGLGLYALAIVAAVAVALRIQDWSLRHVSALYYDNAAALSPALLGEDEMKAAVVTATSSPEVRARIEAGSRGAPLLVHVVPSEWELPDLPISPPDQLRGGHHRPEFDRRSYKVLFSRARTHRPGDRGADIVKHAYGLDPIVVVNVDTGKREVTGVEVPPRAVQWGDIPTPLF